MSRRWRDITVWKSAWMTSAQSWSRRHHWLSADVIHADFQRVISRYIQNISTCLSCKAQRGLRTMFIQKSKPKYAYLPSKIVAVWIDRFCVRYDWWRRLQPTSSVSPVWDNNSIWFSAHSVNDVVHRIVEQKGKWESVAFTETDRIPARHYSHTECSFVTNSIFPQNTYNRGRSLTFVLS